MIPDPNFYRRAGTAMRTITDAPQVPSQDVSRYQAQPSADDIAARDRFYEEQLQPQAGDDLTILGPANPPFNWRRSLPLIALFVVVCAGMFAPRPVQIGIGVGLAALALVVFGRMR